MTFDELTGSLDCQPPVSLKQAAQPTAQGVYWVSSQNVPKPKRPRVYDQNVPRSVGQNVPKQNVPNADQSFFFSITGCGDKC